MQRCNRCGKESPEGTPFCPACGSAFDEGLEDARWLQPAPVRRSSTWVWRFAALVFGTCLCCGIPLSILIPVFQSAKVAARSSVEIENARAVGLAVLKFADQHHDRLPSFSNANQLARDLEPYARVQNLDALVAEYHWNLAWSEEETPDITDPQSTWLFYEEDPTTGRPYTVGFADGHVRNYRTDQIDQVLHPSQAPAATKATSPPSREQADQQQPQAQPPDPSQQAQTQPGNNGQTPDGQSPPPGDSGPTATPGQSTGN